MALRSSASRLSPAAWPGWAWGLLVTALGFVPVANVFTLSCMFFVRDLTLAFHSRFLWLRQTIYSGQWPWWDPFPSTGQSAAADALYQLFLPPTLLLRLLLPELVAWNLWVALPIPLCAFGAWLYLRRHVTAIPAALGGIAFGLSGPIVSTTNFPNLSWSVAAMPYVLWAVDRVLARGRAVDGAALAAALACQALAGEPVTLAATLGVTAGYVLSELFVFRGPRVRVIVVIAAATGLGLLLAAVQFAPLLAASRNSVRSIMGFADFWSFHPLALIELVVPRFFGDYFNSYLRELAWMVALNSGREPFYYSMYVGVPVLLVALIGATSGRRVALFWSLVLVASIVASLGGNTPIYPWFQRIVPGLGAFRFPVKYLAVSSLALAALTAYGWQMMIDGTVGRRRARLLLACALAVAVAAYVLVAWLLVAPATPIRWFFRLAEAVHVPAPTQGAEYLIFRARPLLTTLFLKLMAVVVLTAIAISHRRERHMARAVLAVALVVDLAAANSDVNPTMKAALLDAPEWTKVLRAHPSDRVYVGGRLEGWLNPLDEDAPKYVRVVEAKRQTDARYLASNQLMYAPSGWGVRETLSFDLPLLWSTEYSRVMGRFKVATFEERQRFLERVGTRYCILPKPPNPGATPLATLFAMEQMKLYDCHPAASRVTVVPDALIGPDIPWQIEGLFQERFDPASGVLVSERPPAAAGIEGPPVAASAALIEDAHNRVVVRAGLPADGYLALFDTYDPDWVVDVDGMPAPLMRANGTFRAVHLTRGQHIVTFTYRPRLVYLGGMVSAGAALALVGWCAAEAGVRRRRRAVTPAAAAS